MSRRAAIRTLSAIDRLFHDFHSKPRLQAGSLLLTLFGDALIPRGGRVWLGSLIRVLAPLGVNERMIRTAIFRLTQDEWLQAQAVGRRADYFLTPVGAQRIQEASRLIYAAQSQPWDQQWRLIVVVRDLSAEDRERLRRSLLWQGFGSIGPNCFIHPSSHLSHVFKVLTADGLGDLLPSLLPMQAAQAPLAHAANDQALIHQAWNLQDLQLRYERFVQTYTPVRDTFLQDPLLLTPSNAFLVRLLLIHDYRRLMLRDPELPGALLPKTWSGELARRVCQDLYRQLRRPSEQHLHDMLVTANGNRLPAASKVLHDRFKR